MTRYANVGWKRKYVQASFGAPRTDGGAGPESKDAIAGSSTLVESSSATHPERETDDGLEGGPPQEKKKRRRRKKPKLDGAGATGVTGETKDGEGMAAGVGGGDEEGHGREEGEKKKAVMSAKVAKGKKKLKEWRRAKDAEARKFASERRRLKRQDARHVNTICFACRETGHAAKDCRKALGDGEDVTGVHAGNRSRAKSNNSVVGICYRCGSRRHNLSRCPNPVDPQNPLPFASCFVCSGVGHLAGSCPQNQEKGVYPNGGCCKLCGQTTHLAKDCDLRKQEVASTKLFVGTGQEVGADEDDFHSFRRRTAEVNKMEKVEDRAKKSQNVKRGAHSGVEKSFGQASVVKPRKVVTF